MRGPADEAASPKYAHVERERRWLVDATRLRELDLASAVAIEDRYIEGTRLRLRTMRSAEGETVFKLTKKYASDDPLARPIVTAYLSEAEHAVLAALPAAPLNKHRFRIAGDRQGFAIDRFEGPLRGLLLAEIELDREVDLRALLPPAWAVREVSHDPRYDGANLARDGIPTE
jgi:CYTH domain-containing protein